MRTTFARTGLAGLLAGALLGGGAAYGDVIHYNESVQGDLDRADFNLSEGSHTFEGSICYSPGNSGNGDCAGGQSDFDLFDIFFADGAQLHSVTLELWDVGGESVLPGTASSISASVSFLLVTPPGNFSPPYLGTEKIHLDSEPWSPSYSLFQGILPIGGGPTGYTFGNYKMSANGSEGLQLDYKVTFVVGPGNPSSAPTGQDEVRQDQIQQVPEAPTALLLLGGFASMIGLRRRARG